MHPCFFIFGMGYTASYLAPKLHSLGFRVIGTKQSVASNLFADPYPVLNFLDPNLETYLSEATHILITIPPIPEIGDRVLEIYGRVIKRIKAQIQWLGYLSSTGVYGDHQGTWVDETSLCLPKGAQSLLRLEAEKNWDSFAHTCKLPLHRFRLSGIYGPGRNILERILAGKKYSLLKEGHYFSRIHVEDLVAMLIASIQNPNPFSIYNLADDKPEASHLVDSYALSLLDYPPLPLVPYEEAKLSPLEQEFYAQNKRVANAKIKKEFGLELIYPGYPEGLKQIFAELSFKKRIN